MRRLRPDQLKMISVFYGIVVAFAASKLLLVNAWIEIHREEPLANWHADV